MAGRHPKGCGDRSRGICSVDNLAVLGARQETVAEKKEVANQKTAAKGLHMYEHHDRQTEADFLGHKIIGAPAKVVLQQDRAARLELARLLEDPSYFPIPEVTLNVIPNVTEEDTP